MIGGGIARKTVSEGAARDMESPRTHSPRPGPKVRNSAPVDSPRASPSQPRRTAVECPASPRGGASNAAMAMEIVGMFNALLTTVQNQHKELAGAVKKIETQHSELSSIVKGIEAQMEDQQGQIASTVKSISGQVTGLTMQLARVHSEIRGEVLGNTQQAVTKFTEINEATTMLVDDMASVKKELKESSLQTFQELAALRVDMRSNTEAVQQTMLGARSADTGATVLSPSVNTPGPNSPVLEGNQDSLMVETNQAEKQAFQRRQHQSITIESPRGFQARSRRRAQFAIPNFGNEVKDEPQAQTDGPAPGDALKPESPRIDVSTIGSQHGSIKGGDPKEFLNSARKGVAADCLAFLACENGTEEWFVALNGVDEEGRTALHWTATNGLSDVVRTMLGNDKLQVINATDKWGKTALHWAAACSHAEVCRLLLNHHSFTAVNGVDCWGQTSLHWAASGGLAETCRQLLMRKDFSMKDAMDNLGRTAGDCATEAGFGQVAKLLGVNSDPPSSPKRMGQKSSDTSSATTPPRARRPPSAASGSRIDSGLRSSQGTPTNTTASSASEGGKGRGRGGQKGGSRILGGERA